MTGPEPTSLPPGSSPARAPKFPWQDFEDWCLLGKERPLAPATFSTMRRQLEFAQRNGLDLATFSPEAGRAYLLRRMREGTPFGGLYADTKALNALSEWRTGTRPFRKPKPPRSQFRFLSTDEVARVLSYRHPDPAVERLYRAVVFTALVTGLRRSELAKMELRDLDPPGRRIYVRNPAKGGLRRWLPLEPWVFSPRRPLMAYARTAPGPMLFPTTGNYLYQILFDVGRATLGRPLSFNITRHTCGTNLRREGWDLLFIKEFLGHASVKSTEIYAGVLPDDMAKLMKRRPRRDYSGR